MTSDFFKIKNSKDKWVILIPLIGIALAALQILFFGPAISTTTSHILNAITFSVFLNTTHVGFTFAAMFFIPEAKTWIKKNFGSNKKFTWGVGLLSVFFISIIALSLGAFTPAANFDKTSGVIALYLISMANIWHNYAQSAGLSLRYNYNIKEKYLLTEAQLQQLNFAGKFERQGVRVIFLIKLFCLLDGLTLLTDFFDSGALPIRILLVGAPLCIVLSIIWVNSRLPYVKSTDKTLFCLRYLVWPFSGFFPSASYVFCAIHGIEYFFVSRQIGQQSTLKPAEKTKYYKMVALGGAVLFFFSIFQVDALGYIFVNTYNANPTPYIVCTAITSGLFFVHSLWDKYFFRFREKANRETSSRLMLELKEGA